MNITVHTNDGTDSEVTMTGVALGSRGITIVRVHSRPLRWFFRRYANLALCAWMFAFVLVKVFTPFCFSGSMQGLSEMGSASDLDSVIPLQLRLRPN